MADAEHFGLGGKQAEALEGILRLGITNEIPVGTRFSQVEVAQQLGLTRTAVRQALSVLAFMGSAEAVPQVGTRLVSPTSEELKTLRSMAKQGEIEALGKFRNADPQNIENVRSTFGNVSQRSHEGEDAFLQSDSILHQTLCAEAGVQAGAILIKMLGIKSRLYRADKPDLGEEWVARVVETDGNIVSRPGFNLSGLNHYYTAIRHADA